MKQKIIALAALAALGTASAPALAGEAGAQARVTDVGVVIGGGLGAIAGGPPGAIAGMTLGGVVADREVAARRNGELEAETAALARERRQLQAERGVLQARVVELDRHLAHERQLVASRPDVSELADGLAFSVGFRTDSADPPAATDGRLEALALLLAAVPALEVQLDGYADPRGAEAHNLALSQARATAIRDRLVAAGIPASRIRMTGHGAPNAAETDADPDGWALQRRVEIRLERDEERVVARP
mgnify:CR=1 FL=1